MVFIYVSVLFLDRMDVTIVNVAMPTFSSLFHVKVTQTDWISTGFLLALAVVIPICGWVVEQFGAKSSFLAALVLFTGGSLCCACAWNLPSLVAFRIIQGIGGGMLIPIGMSMVYHVFLPHQYAKLASYTLMPTLLAPAIAPTLGGLLLVKATWHWIFLVNVPIGACAILIVILFIHEKKPTALVKLDLLGFLLSATALASLLFTLSRLGQYGMYDRTMLSFAAASLLSFVLFIYREKYAAVPLLNLKFLRIPLFVQANLLQFSLQISYFGSMFLIALYFQVCIGMNPVQSGLSMFTQALGTICMLPFSARLFNRFGPKYFIIFGLFALALTTLAILSVHQAEQVALAASLLFLRGVSIGLVNSPIQACSMFLIEKAQLAKATSIFSAGRQVAISLGVALSSMLLASELRKAHLTLTMGGENKLAYPLFAHAFYLVAACALSGIIVAIFIDNKGILAKLRER